jgi:hypothetical protein
METSWELMLKGAALRSWNRSIRAVVLGEHGDVSVTRVLTTLVCTVAITGLLWTWIGPLWALPKDAHEWQRRAMDWGSPLVWFAAASATVLAFLWIKQFRAECAQANARDKRLRELHRLLAQGVHLRGEALRLIWKLSNKSFGEVRDPIQAWNRDMYELARDKDADLIVLYREEPQMIGLPVEIGDEPWREAVQHLDHHCTKLAALIHRLESAKAPKAN